MTDATPGATATVTPEPSVINSPATDDWRASLPSDIKEYGGFANYKSIADLAKGKVEADALIARGQYKPPEPTDEKGVAELFGKYAPKDPKEYKIELAPDLPKDLPIDQAGIEWFKGAAHKAKLPNAAANALVNDYMKYQAEQYSAGMKAQMDAGKAELEALKAEWGANEAINTSKAKIGFKATMEAAGVKPEDAEAFGAELEGKMGTARYLKFMHGIANMIGEDRKVGGQDTSFSMDPAAASRKISEMRSNPQIMAAMADSAHPDHKMHNAEMTRLYGIAYPN